MKSLRLSREETATIRISRDFVDVLKTKYPGEKITVASKKLALKMKNGKIII